MARYKLTIEYDGTDFVGWQRQINGLGVQQVIEEAIYNFSQETIQLFVSGRTDKGVHALGQVAHFDIAKPTTTHTIQHAVNFHLKKHRIRIIDVAEVAPDFHARFMAKSRNYLYRILERSAPPALDIDRVWHMHYCLDLNLMRKAAALLIGKHDFSTFRAALCQAKSPIKSLTLFEIEKHGQEIHFKVEAPSFLYHQVRNMVGTLVQVGLKKWTVGDFDVAFQSKDRTKGGPTAPPQGLYFIKANY
jgi:tRNA pseudouridine38-40 synthase